MEQFLTNLRPLAHNLMRIMVGFAFWTHGGQKLFAWFGREESVELMSRMGAAGVIEFFGGLLITLGLFTRPVAFIISGEMAVAYFWAHTAGRGSLWHWSNGGELALVYCFVFLFIATTGAGSFSLDETLKKSKGTAAT
jgi:putative oxidoreductase